MNTPVDETSGIWWSDILPLLSLPGQQWDVGAIQISRDLENNLSGSEKKIYNLWVIKLEVV